MGKQLCKACELIHVGVGMFAAGDWTCSGCGNTNWARRNTCNMCNTPKPGTVDVNREGTAGGFKVAHSFVSFCMKLNLLSTDGSCMARWHFSCMQYADEQSRSLCSSLHCAGAGRSRDRGRQEA